MKEIEYRRLNLVERVLSHFVIHVTTLVTSIFFFLLNRTRVHGWLNFRRGPGTILLANHRTMIDSYLIATPAAYPWCILRPSVLLYHPAAVENFFGTIFLSVLSRMWRCIPVRMGRRDPKAMRVIGQVLPTSSVLVFPEGTRSRTGTIGAGIVGVGKLIYDTRPSVVPVYVAGMEKVLPIGTRVPKCFKTLDVYFGKPIDMSDLYGNPDVREGAQQIIDRVMLAIHELEETHNASSNTRGGTGEPI